MHCHCEVIMPPTNDIQKTITEILEPFNEKNEENSSGHPFFNWFVIGGKWAGTKETCRYDTDKIDLFCKRLEEAKVTVSGIQFGKQELSSKSQIPIVDKMWNDLFPTENGEITPCPICMFDEIPDSLSCSRVIIAAPSHNGESIEAKFMICEDQWNGVNHMPIEWDGKVKQAIKMFTDKFKTYSPEYVKTIMPQSNWICVTIDYHS